MPDVTLSSTEFCQSIFCDSSPMAREFLSEEKKKKKKRRNWPTTLWLGASEKIYCLDLDLVPDFLDPNSTWINPTSVQTQS